MKKCKLCGKKGLFLKINSNGVCQDCIRLDEINRRVEESLRTFDDLSSKLDKLKQEIVNRENFIEELRRNKNEMISSYKEEMINEYQEEISKKKSELSKVMTVFKEREDFVYKSDEKIESNQKKIESLKAKIAKLDGLYEAIVYSLKHYATLDRVAQTLYNEEIKPSIEVHLHYMDVAELRKKYNENKKNIKTLLDKYEERYSTKTNKTIYRIMVLGLEAEIQNILADLRYGKLDAGKEKVLEMTRKYLSISLEGNQTIVETQAVFIGQLEKLYLNAVEIEYEYYIKKEKIKEEQRAYREQIRQEAAERKLLEEQRAQVEHEEKKYVTEIESLKDKLLTADHDRRIKLEKRIEELELQLEQAKEKKEKIITLQNGIAGYVYVISNIGSFGENVFKIGMTRRDEPQERVNELGCASVPFPFDVHAFIFSNDAVSLERTLHQVLNNKRVNKINHRKEFFRISMDELESVVLKYDPSADFNKTMLAEQYRQSLSIGDTDFIYDVESDIEEEILEEDDMLQ